MGINSSTNGNIKLSYSDFGDQCKELLEYWKTTIEELHWDQVVVVLVNMDLLGRAITSLNSRQLPLEEVGHTHHPIPQASNEKIIIETRIKTHNSESRGQEEAGRTRRMSVLFTGSTGVKFINALNKPPLKLSLSYQGLSTF